MIRIRWASVSRRSWSVHFFASRTLFSCSPYGTGRVTKHALNAGERLFQRRAVGQFCSKPALNMWYGSRQPTAGQVGYSIMLVRYAVLERPLFARRRRLESTLSGPSPARPWSPQFGGGRIDKDLETAQMTLGPTFKTCKNSWIIEIDYHENCKRP